MAEGEQGFTGEEPAEPNLAKRIAHGASQQLSHITEGLRRKGKEAVPQTENISTEDVKTLIADVREILSGKIADEFDVSIDGQQRTAALSFRISRNGTHTLVHLVDPGEADENGLQPFSGVIYEERQKPDNLAVVQTRVLPQKGQVRRGDDGQLRVVINMGEFQAEQGAYRRTELAAIRYRRRHGDPTAEFAMAQQAIEQIKEQRSAA